jgi:hypothetical protein
MTEGERGDRRKPYDDEDGGDDIAQWGHGDPRRQPERDALPGHCCGRERVEVERKDVGT